MLNGDPAMEFAIVKRIPSQFEVLLSQFLNLGHIE